MVQCVKIVILEKFKGNIFDKCYVSMIGVFVYEDVVKLFQKLFKEVQDLDVKMFVSKIFLGLQEYLQMGCDLKKIVDVVKK